MNQDFVISVMSASDVDMAVGWAAEEGWNPGLHDAACFHQAFPHDFFIGRLSHHPIAAASAVIYDSNFAFFGFYIVDKAYRGQGYGFKLTEALMQHMGDRIIGLDGVVEMVDKYKRLGFIYAHANTRYCLSKADIKAFDDSYIVSLAALPFKEVERFDNHHFKANRADFLNIWLAQPNHIALGYVHGNELLGYGVIRPCREGYKIGPLFANTPAIADALFQALCSHVAGKAVYLDIPEPNEQARALVKRYDMKPVFSTARMYTKEIKQLPLNQIYGITTFELG